MSTPRDTVAVVLPALDEEGSVERVVKDFRRVAQRVIVVDNGSSDQTARRAETAGAELVHEDRRGYGAACLRGVAHLKDHPPEVVVFADCDGTLDPDELHLLVDPILDDQADLVLGRRDRIEPGAFPLKNRVARRMATLMLFVLHGRLIRDVPPLRAVSWNLLERMDLRHPTYGLPLETVAMALRRGARVHEASISYHRRTAGHSKVGRTLIESVHVGLLFIVLPVRFRFRRLPA